MWPNSTSGFWIFWIFWNFGISWRFLVFSCHKFPCADEQLSIPLPSLNSTLRWYVLASSLPDNPTCRLEALSITGLLDAIGLFTDEELEATELVRFIAVGLDFAAILFSSDCSCILFAILSVQPNKLKFLAQQRELKWLMLNKQRSLFPFVTCKINFGQNVFELMFGVNVPDLNLRIQIDSVE